MKKKTFNVWIVVEQCTMPGEKYTDILTEKFGQFTKEKAAIRVAKLLLGERGE